MKGLVNLHTLGRLRNIHKKFLYHKQRELEHARKASQYSNKITDKLKDNKIWAIHELSCDKRGSDCGIRVIGRFLNLETIDKKMDEIKDTYPFDSKHQKHIKVIIEEQAIDRCGDLGYWSHGMPRPQRHSKKHLFEAFETELRNHPELTRQVDPIVK